MNYFQRTIEKFRPPHYYGCDVGAALFKFVELKKNGSGLSLVRHGMVATEYRERPVEAAGRIRLFLKKSQVSLGRAGVNVEHDTLRIRRMDLPEMPARDLKIAIRWNFRDLVDGDRDSFVVGYSILQEKTSTGKRPIIGYGISNKAIQEYTEFLRKAGLKPVSIEPNATALLAAFEHNIGFNGREVFAIVDIGEGTANFVIVANGKVLFSRPLLDIHLHRIIKMIAEKRAVDSDVAHFFLSSYLKGLREKAANTSEGTVEISEVDIEAVQQSAEAFLSQFVIEVQRSIDAFTLMFKVDRVDGIYLCGGGALLPDIAEHLTKSLGIKSQIFNPFAAIQKESGSEAIDENDYPLYAVAVGLAMPK